MPTSIPCFVCNAELEKAFPDSFPMSKYGGGLIIQPYHATTFSSSGQYGSTVFDPMDGSYITINICDKCLTAAAKQNKVVISRESRPVVMGNTRVGWEKMDSPYIYWTGQDDLDDDARVVPATRAAAIELNQDSNVKLNLPITILIASIEQGTL